MYIVNMHFSPMRRAYSVIFICLSSLFISYVYSSFNSKLFFKASQTIATKKTLKILFGDLRLSFVNRKWKNLSYWRAQLEPWPVLTNPPALPDNRTS